MKKACTLTGIFLFALPLSFSSRAIAADESFLTAEPVEFLPVCDAYGRGYVRISGTGTCMRFSGYVRSQIKGGKNTYVYKGSNKADTYAWRARADLAFDITTETDLGTLRARILLREQWDNGTDTEKGKMHNGYIELAGVRVGLDKSRFWTWSGNIGKVNSMDIVNKGVYKRTNAISYVYSTDGGFSALLALEQGNNESIDNAGTNYYIKGNGNRIGASSHTPGAHKARSGSQMENYAPNILFGVKYVRPWGKISGIAAYQSYQSEWSGKIRLDLNITNALLLWAMVGYKTNDDYYAYDGRYSRGKKHAYYYRMYTSQYADWGGDFAFWAGHTLNINKKASFNSQLTYDQSKVFTASFNIAYQPVPQLTLTPEISYRRWGDDKKWADGARVTFNGENAFQGTLRLQRDF